MERIVYCDCAHARVIPPATKAAVRAHIDNSGTAVTCVPDLCELSARRDPQLKALADGRPVLIVACYERAVRGLFEAAGAPLPESGVRVANMRADSVDAITARIASTVTEPPDALATESADPETAGNVRSTPENWKPWFPVIDYSRCTNCMQCLSFCLFDVYGVSSDRKIQVQNPSNCKTECPACSRVCPEVAIMFPKYRHAPINGDVVSTDDVRREAMKIDISALLGGDVYAMLRDRSAKAKSRFSKERDEDRALKERQTCLVKLQQQMDVPAEVIAALPSPEEIQRRAEAAAARAKAALEGDA
jgi:NAD-dependent dihydropyrimidine dehydrogenase PreA subunit